MTCITKGEKNEGRRETHGVAVLGEGGGGKGEKARTRKLYLQ